MPLRIAYITHYADLFGANRSMLDLIMEARRRGAVEPLVILPHEGPLSARLTEERIIWRVFPFQPWMSERRYMGGPHHRVMQYLRYKKAAQKRADANARSLPEVVRWLHEEQVRAVHLNSAAVGLAPGLGRSLSIPWIWHIRELPERHYALHLDPGRSRYGRTLRSADRLIAISEAVKSDILRYTGRPVPIRMIHNGVLRLAQYQDLREHAAERWSNTKPFIFTIIGLIHPGKGQEEAVRAVDIVRRERPDVELVIAGSGRDQRLRELIAELGVGQWVKLAGFVDDPIGLFQRSHALLMCSRNEAMGRVTVEAMATGLPVIGLASGGTLELLQDGVNGLLYPGGASVLASHMLALMKDPANARALGTRAMDLAPERFSVEHMTDRILEVYAEVMPQA